MTIASGGTGLLRSSSRNSFSAAPVSRRALHHEIKDHTFIVNGAPKIHALAADGADHLTQVPSGTCGRRSASEIVRNLRSEFVCPVSDRFIAEFDAAFCQQFLDIAKAQRESKVQPNRLSDNIGRKPMPFERNRCHSPSRAESAQTEKTNERRLPNAEQQRPANAY